VCVCVCVCVKVTDRLFRVLFLPFDLFADIPVKSNNSKLFLTHTRTHIDTDVHPTERFPKGLVMSFISPEKLLPLQRQKTRVRNMTIVAHVDHGKTSLADCLIASNGIISNKLAGRVRLCHCRLYMCECVVGVFVCVCVCVSLCQCVSVFVSLSVFALACIRVFTTHCTCSCILRLCCGMCIPLPLPSQ
jgi:Elongation factor Tu GTP binding domain